MSGSASGEQRLFLLRLYLSAELPIGPGRADGGSHRDQRVDLRGRARPVRQITKIELIDLY